MDDFRAMMRAQLVFGCGAIVLAAGVIGFLLYLAWRLVEHFTKT